MEWWRKAMFSRWLTADKVVLAVLLSVWWFFLQRDDRVLNLVDTASYLTAVYSVWRVAGSVCRWSRSARAGRLRSEVAEGGEDRAGVAELSGDSAKSRTEGGIVGRQNGSRR